MKGFEEVNIASVGTAKYYKDVIENIHLIARDYDGHNIDNAKSMKDLVDELDAIAVSALKGKAQYLKPVY